MTILAFGTQVMVQTIWAPKDSHLVTSQFKFGWTIAEESFRRSKLGTDIVTVMIRVVAFTERMEPSFVHLTKQ